MHRWRACDQLRGHCLVQFSMETAVPGAITTNALVVAHAKRNFHSSHKPPRRTYDAAFKLMVVRDALKRPVNNRIKPTCRAFPGVQPVRSALSDHEHALSLSVGACIRDWSHIAG